LIFTFSHFELHLVRVSEVLQYLPSAIKIRVKGVVRNILAIATQWPREVEIDNFREYVHQRFGFSSTYRRMRGF
jgi:hypothetical protein